MSRLLQMDTHWGQNDKPSNVKMTFVLKDEAIKMSHKPKSCFKHRNDSSIGPWHFLFVGCGAALRDLRCQTEVFPL